MLTAALRVYHWDRATSSISSDRLEADALSGLEPALAVYRARVGQPRGQVRNAARLALDALRPDRVEPVVKLLDEVATYEWPPTARAAERRVAVFEAAARRHPLLEAGDAREMLAVTFTPAPADQAGAVASLYADYPEFHRLVAFPRDYTAEALRSDYDLAQAQALLYSATRVTVEAGRDFKHILRYARLARLLHRVERLRPLPAAGRGRPGRRRAGGRPPSDRDRARSDPERGDQRPARGAPASGVAYRFVLDGPNSVLRRTRAYGVDFARFLAALVRLGDWRLQAEIELRKGWRPLLFTLTGEDGLGAGLGPPPEFDSELESAIARKFGRRRAGWQLVREGAVLEAGASLVVPDFVFRHEDGTEVALEIVGYWTPEYLADKLGKLAAVRGVNLIVAVPRPLAVRAGALPAAVLPFKRRLLLRNLLPRLESFRTPAP
jgi:predicted nuclease of restriction endonuclease-like RecB superfamily